MTVTLEKNKGIKRVILACGYSRDGFISCFKSEAAFRQELLMCAVMAPLAFFLAPDRASLAIMLACLFAVLIVEMINSAIEAIVDRAGTEFHLLAKKAKDIGSAAVLLALVNLAVVWGLF